MNIPDKPIENVIFSQEKKTCIIEFVDGSKKGFSGDIAIETIKKLTKTGKYDTDRPSK